jgi:hypothetical protein
MLGVAGSVALMYERRPMSPPKALQAGKMGVADATTTHRSAAMIARVIVPTALKLGAKVNRGSHAFRRTRGPQTLTLPFFRELRGAI